ncbi:hypothetical protein [Phenylobacterium sp.]|jgi:hypothetical protein|uniref:hypothetical protein n=1 Tax=Phenylobacterium sp. TaxID=1871053 RepID=UPI002F415AB7
MTDPDDPANLAVRRAAQDFARSLARHEMLSQAVRLEATLYPTGEGSLFGVDRALAEAWPRDAGAPPAQEVILVRAGGRLQGVKLSAFDSRGRALLRRHYMADAAGAVERAEPPRKAVGHE